MSRFNEGDRLQYIAKRNNRTGSERGFSDRLASALINRLDERQVYVVEHTSNIGVRIDGVWYHQDLFELAPEPIPNPEGSSNIIRIDAEGIHFGTGELVSVRVPPTVEQIRARWNVAYNYDMNMANQAPEDIKTLLEHFDALQKAHDYQQSEAERYEHEARESAAENGRYIREKNEAVDERNDALSRLSAVEDMLLQWDSTADVSIEDMQAMLMEQVNGE